MREMSLRDFKEEYFPTMKGVEFSAMLGFNNSFISKILNGKYDCPTTSPKWVELAEWVKRYYEVKLVTTAPSAKFFEVIDNRDKTINRLRKENEELKKENQEMQELIVRLMGSVRLCEDVKKAISYGSFKLEQYRNRKGK